MAQIEDLHRGLPHGVAAKGFPGRTPWASIDVAPCRDSTARLSWSVLTSCMV